ncbi:MAG: RsbRD N-terminal domain-containing protein [Planctomycetota bacterium]|jgi:hypothetical protein
MKALGSPFPEKKAAILQRWLEETLASYAPETSAFLHRGKDRFANPVGHALRTGTAGVLDALVEDMDPDRICRHLDEIIRVRAVQDMTPAEAVAFVFSLKKAARDVVGDSTRRPELTAGLLEFDTRVDQVALFAFDIYSRCRDQLGELRINEMKRSVAALLERYHKDDPAETADRNGSGTNSKCPINWRGGDR